MSGRTKARKPSLGEQSAFEKKPIHIMPEDPLDRLRFPTDDWALIETQFDPSDLGVTETLFAVGNAYLGMRGNPEEGRPTDHHGTFINGFHETWPIQHAEQAYGFARTGQTIVNVPDAKTMKLYVDDEPLTLATADLLEYERRLDFRTGELTRDLVWRTPSGKRVQVRTRRMASLTERHLAVLSIEVTMLEGNAPVVISSQLINRQDGQSEYQEAKDSKDGDKGKDWDPRKAGAFKTRVLHPAIQWQEGDDMGLGYACAASGMTIAVAARHHLETGNSHHVADSVEPDLAKRVITVQARQGEPIRLTKLVAYQTSSGVPVRELVDRAGRTLKRADVIGIDGLREHQRLWLDRFWADADVEIPGHPALQQAVRWNLFQLAQASARSDGYGIPAKGVTGSGYEGHYFWDTETYVVPFLAYTCPTVARNTLRFRVGMLPKARERARELSQDGALFPWRTINGEEASAYYAAGTAQYHINADIAYAVDTYVSATGDHQFLEADGVEILVETARLWADLGFWRVNGARRFDIHGVTGPDEYTTVVNNNLFTNVMARFNLRRAADAVDDIRENAPETYQLLQRDLGLRDDEAAQWRDCAEGIEIPYDEKLGIHPQDAQFLEKEMWDLSTTPLDRRPLLLHFHPLVIYRFQVLKQADVVLALFLQGDDFTYEEKKANFEYYDPITTGDSTLSAVVQSIIASEVGYQETALDYFLRGLYVDLADLHHNASDGVHIASAGGVWSALISGFGGMRRHGTSVSFDPRLPEGWPELTFRIRLDGVRMRITITQDAFTAVVDDGGDQHDITVRGETITVTRDGVTVPLPDQGPRLGALATSAAFTAGRHPVGTTMAEPEATTDRVMPGRSVTTPKAGPTMHE